MINSFVISYPEFYENSELMELNSDLKLLTALDPLEPVIRTSCEPCDSKTEFG